MSKPDAGTQIRVRHETRFLLLRLIERRMSAAADGLSPPFWEGDDCTMNDFILRLLDGYMDHLGRARKSRKRRRERGRAERDGMTFIPTDFYHVGDGTYRRHPYAKGD